MPPALKKQRTAGGAREAASAGSGDKARKRKEKQEKRVAFARRVHDRGLQILQQAGFKRLSPCEAIGDCWMISIMAGHDARIPINKIERFTDARRKN